MLEIVSSIETRVTKGESRINELELLVNAIKDRYNSLCAPSLRKEPFKCPVCDGVGNNKGVIESKPDFGFYMKYDSCDACKGNGIVWG